MSLIGSTTPHIVSYRKERHYSIPIVGSRHYRDDETKVLGWPCTDPSTPTESDHSATYAVDGWEFGGGEKQIAYGKRTGMWLETYVKKGTWT